MIYKFLFQENDFSDSDEGEDGEQRPLIHGAAGKHTFLNCFLSILNKKTTTYDF